MRRVLALISLACACMAHYGAQNLPLSMMSLTPKPLISRPGSYGYPLGENPPLTGLDNRNANVGSSSYLDELVSNLPFNSHAGLGSDHSNGELRNSQTGWNSGNSFLSSRNYLGGLSRDNVESINSLTGLDSELKHKGDLPGYYQALKDFDVGMRDVNTHLNIDRHSHKDNPRHQYVIIANVVSDLAMNVARRDGIDPSSYDDKYMTAVMNFIQEADKHPSDVVRKIRCLLDKMNHAIAELRHLMASPWINFVCRGTKMCDVLIHAAVKIGNRALKKEAEILLALGRASSLYLHEYAEKFKKGSDKLILSVLSSKDMLRPLVNAEAAARRLVFPDEFKCITAYGVANCASTTCLLGKPDESGASYDAFRRKATTATGPDPGTREYRDSIRRQQAQERYNRNQKISINPPRNPPKISVNPPYRQIIIQFRGRG